MRPYRVCVEADARWILSPHKTFSKSNGKQSTIVAILLLLDLRTKHTLFWEERPGRNTFLMMSMVLSEIGSWELRLSSSITLPPNRVATSQWILEAFTIWIESPGTYLRDDLQLLCWQPVSFSPSTPYCLFSKKYANETILSLSQNGSLRERSQVTSVYVEYGSCIEEHMK